MDLPIFEIFLDESLSAVHSKVSLVKDPAVELNLIKFNSEDKPLFFANEEKREVYAVAMRPNKMIFRKNVSDLIGVEQPANVFYSAETIKKFQKLYFKNASNVNVNLNHEEEDTTGVYCFESWIVDNPEIDKSKTLNLETISGDLVMAFKIDNDEVWQQCKNGDLDGLSIEAYFDKQLINKNEVKMTKEERTPESLWSMLKSFFAADNTDVVETEEEKAKRLEEEAKVAEEMAAEPVAANPMPADDTEMLKAENEALKTEVADLKTKLADMEAEKVKAETNLETMKSQTPKAVAVPITPKVDMKVEKPYEQMTNFEKLQFNRQK